MVLSTELTTLNYIIITSMGRHLIVKYVLCSGVYVKLIFCDSNQALNHYFIKVSHGFNMMFYLQSLFFPNKVLCMAQVPSFFLQFVLLIFSFSMILEYIWRSRKPKIKQQKNCATICEVLVWPCTIWAPRIFKGNSQECEWYLFLVEH